MCTHQYDVKFMHASSIISCICRKYVQKELEWVKPACVVFFGESSHVCRSMIAFAAKASLLFHVSMLNVKCSLKLACLTNTSCHVTLVGRNVGKTASDVFKLDNPDGEVFKHQFTFLDYPVKCLKLPHPSHLLYIGAQKAASIRQQILEALKLIREECYPEVVSVCPSVCQSNNHV